MTRLTKALSTQIGDQTKQLLAGGLSSADPPNMEQPYANSANRTGASEQSFATFFEREAAGQVRRATLLTGSAESANDIVQDVFIKIYGRWSQIEDPGPYLNRAVLNGCRDHARSRARTLKLLPRLIERGSDQPQEPLADVLNGLPFNHRAAIVLKFWGGLSTQQIADELGCQPGSVGPWLNRGMKKLRNELS